MPRIALAVFALLLAQAANAQQPIIYHVNHNFQGNVVSGTITTDGTLGAWGSTDHIVSYSLDIAFGYAGPPGGQAATINPPVTIHVGTPFAYGGGFVADATTLSFADPTASLSFSFGLDCAQAAANDCGLWKYYQGREGVIFYSGGVYHLWYETQIVCCNPPFLPFPIGVIDNCPNVDNPLQEDADGDLIGDACDPFPNEADHAKAQCFVDLGDSNAALYTSQADLAQAQSDLSATIASLLQCQGDLGASQSSLFQTQADLSVCQVNLSDSNATLYQSQLDLAQTQSDLATCQARRVFSDSDNDGEDDATDRCVATPGSTAVDDAGCSRAQFCTVRASTCKKNDWMNDEPSVKKPGDCTYDNRARTCN